jgi:hypothetical protein
MGFEIVVALIDYFLWSLIAESVGTAMVIIESRANVSWHEV